MADNKSIATRDSYGAALLELADAGHDDIVVFDADLSASTRTSVFAKKYSERFFDCGIAECNMVGVAAGMSTFGYVPFVSSFAMFAAGRAFEQIRNSIGYPELNVKIAATHGGLSVGEDGASHQCCEDFALMRTIPGMVVICPSDDLEARAAVRAAYAHKGPVYLRFSRLATPSLHDANNYTFEIGKGEVLCDGFDLAIISTGLMTSEALKAAVTLKRQDAISVRVINMPTIKPLDEEIVLRAARECHKIITVEEHSVIGGLGEAVCSLLSEKAPTPVRRIGVQDKFGHSGPAWEVLRDYGLTADAIANEAEFFSFGTNDLTQMTFGLSRDDAAKFLGSYYDTKIFESDPFQHLDINCVGKLVEMACKLGRQTNPELELGICGEHGGDPSSVEFCHKVGLDYVSCSPFRVPIARLAAAQAAIKSR